MSFEELRQRLATVIAIPVTPFGDDKQIDVPSFTKILALMIESGITAFTPNGNTGEYYALTGEERRQMVALTCELAPLGSIVVSGVGGSVPQAVGEAEFAARCGASCIMIHQPVHPYQSGAGWVEYNRTVAAAVPEVGIVIYIRDEALSAGDVCKLMDAAPNLVAVKLSTNDGVRMGTMTMASHPGRVTWIAGQAELSAPGCFAYGAAGFTSGLANIRPRLSLDLLDYLRNGDYLAAREVWGRIRRFEELRSRAGSQNNVSVVKEALAQEGLCARGVRPPITTLSQEERRAVTDALASM